MDTAGPSTDNAGDDYRIKKPTAEKDLVWEAAGALDDRIEFHEGEAVLQQTIAPATRGQRAVYSCCWYEYEVCNGGHEQFFWNSTGILWEEAIAGFELMGAPHYVALLRDAISLFPTGRPAKGRDKRMLQLETIAKEHLERLDERLYGLGENEDFDEMVARYIKAHPEEFFLE